MDWIEYVLAFAVFFATHSVPVRPPVRPWLVARLGQRGFMLAYSILSLGILIWLIGAADRAPYLQLWGWAAWQNWLAMALMLPAILLAALSIGRPNPLSFGGARNAEFDPAHPGAVVLTRHPLLAALALWAIAHLIPNGNLAHVILFGVFTGFAVLGMRIVDRRKRRELEGEWERLVDEIQRVSLGFTFPDASALTRVVLGVSAFALMVWAHPIVIGVAPIP